MKEQRVSGKEIKKESEGEVEQMCKQNHESIY